MGVPVVGGITGTALLVVVVIVTVAIRRGRARRVLDRDELLRRASLAAGQIAMDSRRSRRGTMRRGGTGEGSEPNEAAMLGSDGDAGLP